MFYVNELFRKTIFEIGILSIGIIVGFGEHKNESFTYRTHTLLNVSIVNVYI